MNNYEETHIKTYRFKCRKTKTGFPVSKTGNYESMLSFKDLPPFKELKKTGRGWEYSKNYSPIVDRIVLDIDCDGNLKKAYAVTKEIMQELNAYKDSINIYFSGSKGFHLEILTDGLDIVDTTAEKPKDSCYPYLEFLTYFESKYNEVDLSLKDGVTRILRRHHTKHEKTGNYKILVNPNASLDEIISNSQANKDMIEPKTIYLDKGSALNLLSTFSKPIERDNSSTLKTTNQPINADNIFTIVYWELKTNIHAKIGLLGSGLNGYVDRQELDTIYQVLKETTDIEDSTNAKQSFIDAYEEDNIECNLGALYKHYEKYNLDQTNLNRLSNYLKDKLASKDYETFNNKMLEYPNWFEMLETELFDYVDNTENLFKGIINSLSALYGYGSRFIVVNGGAEVGKSEFVKTIEKLMPKFKNMGSSTPASIRRQHEYEFNRKIVYLGDKGLKGKEDDEFKGLQEVFGGLITEKEFIRDLVVGESVMQFNLKSDGLCVFYTEPYTNLRIFGAGDQYTTRTTYITVNPVKNGLNVFLLDENKENAFYGLHKNYIRYILKNPIDVDIGAYVRTELFNASNKSLRTAKYLLALLKAYCQYLRIKKPSLEDLNEFLKIFKPKYEVTDIEYAVYLKLYKNLNVLKKDEIEDLYCYDSNSNVVIDTQHMLLQTKDRKEKSLFTAKQIKTYFRTDFKMNKNLKDTLDNIPEILKNLYDASYLERLDEQYNGQNIYYIPYNADMGE